MHSSYCLRSRSAPLRSTAELQTPYFDINNETKLYKGNGIRTNHMRYRDSLIQWRTTLSWAWDCPEEQQTILHIVTECPVRTFDEN